ncbi:MAG: family 43 glycosylhydrolase [Catenulispora sp.]|nr:family 43 glycosylhydrolase [Catenulispora sp.]
MRFRILSSAAVLIAALVPLAASAPTAGAATTFTSTVVNQASGNCADDPYSSTTAGTQLIQYSCNTGTNQNWTFAPVSGTSATYTITNAASGMCIDVSGRSTADNAQVIQWSCNGQSNQQFTVQAVGGAFGLVAVHSGKCVAPSGDSTAGSTGLVQSACTGAGTRLWKLPGYNGGGGTGGTYTNPLKQQGPDPTLRYYNGYYYLATTTWNNTITMRKSATLGGLASAPDTLLFTLTRSNGNGTMWAPDLELLNGPDGLRWYLYYVAGATPFDLNTQRIHVLESAGTDPMGPYSFKADLLDPVNDNTWELDPTIVTLNSQLYLMGTFYDPADGTQPLFIRPLNNPWTASGTRHRITDVSYGWESIGGAVNEAPAVITHNGTTFVTFSASHCSTPDYKVGVLTYNGGDPLQKSSWVKAANPAFQRSDADGVYGPGSNGFFKSPDGTQDWMVYNANSSAGGGCDMNRSTRAQKITWNADGTPNLGVPVATGVRLTAPSGEPAS